jgi:hypothetical protein
MMLQVSAKLNGLPALAGFKKPVPNKGQFDAIVDESRLLINWSGCWQL